MSNKNSLLSLVIPVHNESSNLEWHYDSIVKCMSLVGRDYEIIYIDDGSQDNSLAIIKKLAERDSHIHYISFSRNFGKEAATSAGIQRCVGDAALMLDADGQHPIELVNKFLEKWEQGYQVIIGVRTANQNEGLIKRYGSKLFYRMLNSVTEGETVPRSTDFRLVDRQVINEFNRLTEHNRMTRGLIDWLGFRRATIEFEAPARHSGKATYGFSKLVRLALHGFVSQTTRPLQAGGVLGAITMLLSALAALFLIVEKYIFGDPWHLAITGTAILALVVTFLVGLVLICQWLLALYIESIHNETQNRPLYIVSEEK